MKRTEVFLQELAGVLKVVELLSRDGIVDEESWQIHGNSYGRPVWINCRISGIIPNNPSVLSKWPAVQVSQGSAWIKKIQSLVSNQNLARGSQVTCQEQPIPRGVMVQGKHVQIVIAVRFR